MTHPALTLVPIVLAIALDLACGDPPNRFHPVAWIGSALTAARRGLPTRGRLLPLLCGALLMGAGLVELLEREMTADLQAIRVAAIAEACAFIRSLISAAFR